MQFILSPLVHAQGANGGASCPAGSVLVSGTYYATGATGGNDPELAIGEPVAEGTKLTTSAVVLSGAMILDLTGDPTILAAEGDVIEVALASRRNSQGIAEILMSADGVNYTSLGTTGDGGSVYGAWGRDIIRYDDFTVPAGGARYLQVNRLANGVRVDGVIYDSQCHLSATPPVIVATDDAETVTSQSAAHTNVLNVVDNDTFDAGTPTSFDLTVSTGSTLPAELTFDTATGAVGVVAGTVAGDYSFDYDICEAGTTNCQTATVTITVETAPILAVAETFPAINGASGGATTSVLASDTLNNQPVVAADVTITVGTSAPELTLDANTGLITVAAGTAAGTYTVAYTICENLNPANCSTVTETVEVTAPAILAVAETFPAINGGDGGATTSVLASDTLNSQPVVAADVTITVGTSAPELTLDANTGLITVAAGTAAGTYTVTYTICENLNSANCSTVTETVEVTSPAILAVAETFPAINGGDGGATTSVLASDTLNNQPVVAADVTITVGTSAPELTLDANTGLITVAAGTAAGTYTVAYTICENANATNCSSVTESVEVTAPEILAVAESFPSINGGDGGVTTTVLASDTLNGQPVAAADVTLTVGTSAPELTLDPATGLITVAAQTLPGTYTVDYTICQVLNPANCSSTTETVTVRPALADLSILKTNTLGVNGNIDQAGDTVTSGQVTTYSVIVTNNGPDNLNGAVVTDTPGAGLTCLGSDSVTISGSGVPAGSYTISDLTGVGITMGMLANGDSATFTYSCTVN